MFATLRSFPLQKAALVARKEFRQSVAIAARLAGLQPHFDRPALRFAHGVVPSLTLLWLTCRALDSSIAALAFLASTVLRFGFLFASFTRRGIASRLKTRLGVERAHTVYAMVLDLLLFVQRAGFVALLCATAREPSGRLGVLLQVLGLLIVPAGIAVTIWATRQIGVDGYHYRDLFIGSRTASIEDDGAYAVCPNPMYLLGPLSGYGLAMLALSPIAMFATGLNQALLFVFNYTVEQPRLRRANGIFMETQRRYALARSLLGFDPRQELTQRRHADPSVQTVAADASHVTM